MAEHPPKGTIVFVTTEGDLAHTWHSFPVGTIVMRARTQMNGIAAYYVDHKGFAQWLDPGSITVIEKAPDGAQSWTLDDCVIYLATHLATLKIPSTYASFPILLSRPKTQKGRGLYALAKLGFITKKTILVNKHLPITQLPDTHHTWFARPCPSRPRHGFVESRIVKTAQELEAVRTETLQADPHGEVICMPALTAPYSAVLTNSLLAVGSGTDGATSGQHALQVPCYSNIERALQIDDTCVSHVNGKCHPTSIPVRDYLPLKPTEQLFVETVGTHVVQLRTGPALMQTISARTRWSPYEYTRCAFVMEVSGSESFAQFEQDLARYRELYGAECFVYCKTGSMVSHYMIQAIVAKVSVMLGPERPIVGKSYVFPVSEPPLPVSAAYRKAVREGLAHGSHVWIDSDAVSWAVAVIQGIGPAYYTLTSVRLLATAGMILLKASTATCLGEYRHFFSKGPGQLKLTPLGPIGNPLQYVDIMTDEPNRTDVYSLVFHESWPRMPVFYQYREYLSNAYYDFKYFPWRAAFGGPKWADCTEAVLKLYEAMLPICRTTTRVPETKVAACYKGYVPEVFQRMVAAANRVITVSHNSGKCLTKLVGQSSLDYISLGGTGLVLAHSPLTWKVLTTSCLPRCTRTPKCVTPKADISSLPTK